MLRRRATWLKSDTLTTLANGACIILCNIYGSTTSGDTYR